MGAPDRTRSGVIHLPGTAAPQAAVVQSGQPTSTQVAVAARPGVDAIEFVVGEDHYDLCIRALHGQPHCGKVRRLLDQ